LVFEPEQHLVDKKGRWRLDVNYCPKDNYLCSFRVCPYCESDLPHYAGYIPGQVIAVVGSRAAGKTCYVLSLLQHLMSRAGNPVPGLVPMFEDDRSYRWFAELYQNLLHRGDLPEPTKVGKEYDPEPINIRLYGSGWLSAQFGKRRSAEISFLVIYDPPGELFESFENASFVRYLGYASAILLILDVEKLRAPGDSRRARIGPLADKADAVNVVNALAQNVRGELGLPSSKKVGIPLAVVLTQCDRSVYPAHPRLVWSDSNGHQDARQKRTHLDQAHRYCQRLLQQWKQDQFLNAVHQQFSSVGYFPCSALGPSGRAGNLGLSPQGVADPLLWAL
jgi:GTPase SAR1 family protein